MKIIGLDVGRGSAVLCRLESFINNILRAYRQLKKDKQFFKKKSIALVRISCYHCNPMELS